MSKKQISTVEFSQHLRYIDSHCHLDMSDYQPDLSEVIKRAKDAGIKHIISIGINLQSSFQAIALAKSHPEIFATIGVHPNDVDSISKSTFEHLENLYLKNPSLVKGFGEIGLDYYREHTSQTLQREHFANQLGLAEKLHLPVIVHNREANNDCLEILKEFTCEAGCLMHCFGSDYAFAKKVIDRGMYISLSGVVTFKNAPEIHQVAKNIPLDKLLIETDGPFLAPVPFRGKRNEPSYIPYIAAQVAELRGISLEEVSEAIYQNTVKFFNLPKTS